MRSMPIFPFSAVIGQERMKRALLASAVNPRIGGVLIMGQRGSAKSTAARGLANLLPYVTVPAGCPLACDPAAPEGWCPTCVARGTSGATEERQTSFVSLPLGATQDRVVGTLDLEGALTQGRKRWEPGLLARAHRGLLYIDEVNLLPDHLVDLLLDAAASGINTVEREGISLSHPSRFILVGTMNPDEGDLRPQLLDRFGLCVEAETLLDADRRAEVVARTLAFEVDPGRFLAQWEREERLLRQRLAMAHSRFPQVRLPEGFPRRIAELCACAHVEGLRADIVIQKTALALAAWEGRDLVSETDVEEAALMALPHRRRPAPPSSPSQPPRSSPGEPGSHESNQLLREPVRQEGGYGSSTGGAQGAAPSLQTPTGAICPVVLPGLDASPVSARASRGRNRERRATLASEGPVIGATLPNERPVRTLAIAATLRATAARLAVAGRSVREARFRIRPEDFRIPVRQVMRERLYLFVVDASGSMAAKRRMEVTKGLLLGLLERAYHKRDRVALLTFSGTRPQWVLPPTRSVRRAQRLLRDLPVGGRTPMAEALRQVRQMADLNARITREMQQAIVVVSDGRSNVGSGAVHPIKAVAAEFSQLAKLGLPVILLDAEEGPVRLGLMAGWARHYGFMYARLAELQATSWGHVRIEAICSGAGWVAG